ncbi:MAG: hypothetical protein MZU97_11870 [Bacillus subtilis]|nr:hypothetical protein [Bacillus subtilis]
MAFQYDEIYNENIISFVNNIRTKDGGTHETGFKSALTKVVQRLRPQAWTCSRKRTRASTAPTSAKA